MFKYLMSTHKITKKANFKNMLENMHTQNWCSFLTHKYLKENKIWCH